MLEIEREGKAMNTLRYRIISRENLETPDFIRLDIAGFRNPDAAIEVCKRIDCPAYVMDTFESKTLYVKA